MYCEIWYIRPQVCADVAAHHHVCSLNMLLFNTVRNAMRYSRHATFYRVPCSHHMTGHSLTFNMDIFETMPYLWQLRAHIWKYIIGTLSFININILPSSYDFNCIATVIFHTTTRKYNRLHSIIIYADGMSNALMSHFIPWNGVSRSNLFKHSIP